MIRRNPLAAAVLALVLIGALDLLLLASGYRILVGETRRHVTIVPADDAGEDEIGYDLLDCRYFTGRGVAVASVRAEAVDACPALFRPYPADAR